MDDLRAANVDFITIGQYLPPTPKHAKLEKFITPQEFDEYKKMAYAKGFIMLLMILKSCKKIGKINFIQFNEIFK